jgi:hypothetical protein
MLWARMLKAELPLLLVLAAQAASAQSPGNRIGGRIENEPEAGLDQATGSSRWCRLSSPGPRKRGCNYDREYQVNAPCRCTGSNEVGSIAE